MAIHGFKRRYCVERVEFFMAVVTNHHSFWVPSKVERDSMQHTRIASAFLNSKSECTQAGKLTYLLTYQRETYGRRCMHAHRVVHKSHLKIRAIDEWLQGQFKILGNAAIRQASLNYVIHTARYSDNVALITYFPRNLRRSRDPAHAYSKIVSHGVELHRHVTSSLTCWVLFRVSFLSGVGHL